LLIDLGEMFLFPTEGPKYKLGMKGRLNELSATILQNIVMDMLAILINRAKEQGHTWSMMVCLFCNMLMTQFALWIIIWTRQSI
jgi:hypothetical protein